MSRITTRIDRIVGSVFVVHTMSADRSQARGLRGPRRSSARDPRWADLRVPCPRGMNEGGFDLRR
jgi:hypothetical protein